MLFLQALLLSLFAISHASAQLVLNEPAQTGRFFYMSMTAGFNDSNVDTDWDDHGLHYSDMIVSNNTPASRFQVAINT